MGAVTYVYPQSALVAAAGDGRHRPASHPLLTGIRPERQRVDVIAPPSEWHAAHGELLRLRREETGWSRLRLAQALHVSAPTLCYWESARHSPNPEHRAALERLLGELRP